MNAQVESYLAKYPEGIVALFHQLRQLILDSTAVAPEEVLWAKIPSYYVGESFVRLIPFKDHINIEARTAIAHREALAGYKFTPKGMVQLYLNQAVPQEELKQIFSEILA